MEMLFVLAMFEAEFVMATLPLIATGHTNAAAKRHERTFAPRPLPLLMRKIIDGALVANSVS
jgi:hypothetical protein